MLACCEAGSSGPRQPCCLPSSVSAVSSSSSDRWLCWLSSCASAGLSRRSTSVLIHVGARASVPVRRRLRRRAAPTSPAAGCSSCGCSCLEPSARAKPMPERREERRRELELLREVELLSEVATPAAGGDASDEDGREGDEWALLGEPFGELPPCTLARRPRERPCHVACQAASADSLSKRRVSSCRRPVPQLEASQPAPSPSVRSGGVAGEAALRTALA
mmetsp:Transcript_36661/g.92938  ORF Transcript_36661/g.92938 Transcript_36661/m.92938 type:complete len:220 (+) Transcript_36661:1090-1749(+)